MSVYAPHPWDAVPAAPPPVGKGYDDPEPEREGKKYLLSFEYESTVEVVNASELTEAEIERVLQETHAHDIRWDNPPSEGDVSVIETDPKYKADYTVRIVDGRAEVL